MMRKHLVIKGRVQGVCFRDHTREKANELGLTGFVKNLASGDVEVVVEGEEDKINELIEFCKCGPSSARVDDVKILDEDYQGEFSGFEVRF